MKEFIENAAIITDGASILFGDLQITATGVGGELAAGKMTNVRGRMEATFGIEHILVPLESIEELPKDNNN